MQIFFPEDTRSLRPSIAFISTVRELSNVSMTCSWEGHQPENKQITWKRTRGDKEDETLWNFEGTDKSITRNEATSEFVDKVVAPDKNQKSYGTQHQIVLQDAHVEDSGEYFCVIKLTSSSEEVQTNKRTLMVYRKPL